MVKGAYSTDDPELKSYWENRQNIKSKSLIPSYQKLAQKQDFNASTSDIDIIVEKDKSTLPPVNLASLEMLNLIKGDSAVGRFPGLRQLSSTGVPKSIPRF